MKRDSHRHGGNKRERDEMREKTNERGMEEEDDSKAGEEKE